MTDTVIIGGGPGGYTAAIRAAQLGLRTVVVEREPALGGTCVNIGCIPAKALLTSSEHYEFVRTQAVTHGIRVAAPELDVGTMMRRKDAVVRQNTRGIEYLFRKHGIEWSRGTGTLRRAASGAWEVTVTDASGAPVTAHAAAHVIIATGSAPIELPFLPFDEVRVLSNAGALALPSVPRHLLVIGGGVVGVELASVWRRLGSRVTIVERLPALLPGFDEEMVQATERVLRRQGLDIRTRVTVSGAAARTDTVTVQLQRDGAAETIEADRVLVAIGRRPRLDGIDAAALGLRTGSRGEVLVDGQMRTNLPGLYAIGDCVPGPMLAHKAEEEGIIAAEVIAGRRVHMEYDALPSVVYTQPELAAAGLTEAEARARGLAVRIGRFPFSANGRARTLATADGLVKVIADEATDDILGVHMLGANASELIAEAVLALAFRGAAQDIALTPHAHPTLAETLREAALAVHGRALNL